MKGGQPVCRPISSSVLRGGVARRGAARREAPLPGPARSGPAPAACTKSFPLISGLEGKGMEGRHSFCGRKIDVTNTEAAATRGSLVKVFMFI